MAAPGFGFSAGDFIAAAKLIADVGKALKDAGGAAEDYRQIVSELDLLKNVVLQLQIKHSGPNAHQNAQDPFVKYAKCQADLTLQTLTEFLKTVSKFDAKLGTQAKSGWYHGAGRKAQWAVMQAQDVEKMRAKIGTQLGTLKLLLQLLDGENSNAQTAALEVHGRDASTALEVQSEKFSEASTRTIEAVRASETNQTRDMRSLATQELTTRELLLKKLEETYGTQTHYLEKNQDTLNSIQSHQLSLSKTLSKIKEITETKSFARNISENGTTCYDLAPWSQAGTHSVGSLAVRRENATDSVYDLLNRLVHAIVLSLRDWLIRTWILLPHFWAMVNTLITTIAREPMLLISENITFEDVLGRTFVLQYDFYKHWPVFESFLRKQFRDLPGEDEVTDGRYMLRDSLVTRRIIHQTQWQQSVSPGSKLSMSIEIKRQQEKLSYCRRSDCEGRLERQDQELKCQTCGFVCFLLSRPPTRDGPHVAPEPVCKNQNAIRQEKNWSIFCSVHQTVDSYDPGRTQSPDRGSKDAKTYTTHSDTSPAFPSAFLRYEENQGWSCCRCHNGLYPMWNCTRPEDHWYSIPPFNRYSIPPFNRYSIPPFNWDGRSCEKCSHRKCKRCYDNSRTY